MASRHLARSIAMQTLYEWDFNLSMGKEVSSDMIHAMLERNINEFGPGLEDTSFVKVIIDGVLDKKADLDAIIEKAAPEWPIQQIAIIDRNVLRIGLYELLFGTYKEVPPKVAINESIELAKTFGGANSGKFVNGVLGTVYREMGEPGKEDKAKKDLTTEEIATLPVEHKVGAVVFQKPDGHISFALVHDVFGYWTLAKGSPKEKESLEDAVLRKVQEEEGLLNTKIIQKLGENEYVAHDPDKGNVRRGVVYFLVKTTDTQLQLGSTGGLDDVRWFPELELAELKMYDDVKGFIKKAIKIIK
ncbi:MAG: transcription antitermination factor NusB [Candidatus Ryanbacteria bacterium RIFCSPHIGHO2_02_FULL_45_17b]|uniref:Transcription antitermination protein NusB n=1 Tax=Candidatus Ryanbacteria bacterium RIFCSPHIGHO2_01_FULL_45_22 TaxID=1802114 RepID=A0A1G2G422_9BACT|nr:MAG: transcription antitermination factor NusB [Candidatus Ryanbacteria bacterium RIFCSPHIGHO2_01_FULL_45_22]OGZ47629.1 MAG: transcription antitermination factor NusB [Candidatus Ryanbacteria bacterium RIFCSPHIGHO2_02_FULL_45_17b]